MRELESPPLEDAVVEEEPAPPEDPGCVPLDEDAGRDTPEEPAPDTPLDPPADDPAVLLAEDVPPASEEDPAAAEEPALADDDDTAIRDVEPPEEAPDDATVDVPEDPAPPDVLEDVDAEPEDEDPEQPAATHAAMTNAATKTVHCSCERNFMFPPDPMTLAAARWVGNEGSADSGTLAGVQFLNVCPRKKQPHLPTQRRQQHRPTRAGVLHVTRA